MFSRNVLHSVGAHLQRLLIIVIMFILRVYKDLFAARVPSVSVRTVFLYMIKPLQAELNDY